MTTIWTPTERYTSEQLQSSDNPPPEQLDYLEFSYQAITIHCFGILHGITGGLNREYVDFIKHSIRHVEGVKLAEKGMKQLYRHCGIDEELEDWMVLRPVDCLVMGIQLLADPRCLWMITIDALRERLRKRDPYTINQRSNISDLGESPYFHYLDEHQRRRLVGFLPSNNAIENDLHSISRWYGAILPKPRHTPIDHPQWRRILLLERIMHIPCRSIHMLHYATAYAKKHNHKLVNIFVGETHNTDMKFLAENSEQFSDLLSHKEQDMMQRISDRAQRFARRDSLSDQLTLILKKISYITFLLVGAVIPLSGYVVIWSWLSGL
jgi:hypothetical protein